jgi:hypothetical protein
VRGKRGVDTLATIAVITIADREWIAGKVDLFERSKAAELFGQRHEVIIANPTFCQRNVFPADNLSTNAITTVLQVISQDY